MIYSLNINPRKPNEFEPTRFGHMRIQKYPLEGIFDVIFWAIPVKRYRIKINPVETECSVGIVGKNVLNNSDKFYWKFLFVFFLIGYEREMSHIVLGNIFTYIRLKINRCVNSRMRGITFSFSTQ